MATLERWTKATSLRLGVTLPKIQLGCFSFPTCECFRPVQRPDCDILLGVGVCVWAGLALALAHREMQAVVKGMVQVHSVTYRIVRVRAGHYDVVRLLDDVRVGMFSLGTRREAIIEGDAPEVIREVARAALQGGRTTWAPRRLIA